MTTKPKTRKAPAAKAPKAAPKEMELGAGRIPRSLVEAQDILATTRKLADAVFLMALELGECECGAICSVADVIRDKITESLELIELGKKKLGGETYRLGLETARKVAAEWGGA
jgi:hypothetical protein